MISATYVILAAVAVATYLYLKKSKLKHPPGPKPWPLVGNLLNMPRPLFTKAHTDMKKKYGDVISFLFGTQRFVILNSYSVIKEALTGSLAEIITARPNAAFFVQLNRKKGLVSAEGSLWREHRRFGLKVLKDFGFARQGTEDAISVEIEDLRKRFDKDDGSGLDTKDLLGRAIANVISMLLFNYRAGYQDDEFTDFLEATQVAMQGSSRARLLPVAFPFLLRIPRLVDCLQWIGIPVCEAKISIEFTYKFCRKQIDRHRQMRDSAEPRDYLEAFLLEQERLDNSKQPHSYDDFQLMRTLVDLFIAGTDTTANTLRWSLLYAALYPECQEKLFKEVHEKIGHSKLPQMSDRKNLPYMQAYIDEVQRFSTLAPFSVNHRVSEPVKLQGYDITTEDIILTNLYGVHHDPELWEKPEEFNPERFLDYSSGTPVYRTSEYLVPFSIGRRACMGESLARQELFLFLSGMLQTHKVDIDKPDNLKEVLVGSSGVVHAPGAHKLKFSRR